MELLSRSIQAQCGDMPGRHLPEFIGNPLAPLFLFAPCSEAFFISFQTSLCHCGPSYCGGNHSNALLQQSRMLAERTRFEQESEALARLQHPGIAQIYESVTADTGLGPQPYFAMEFIRGR